MSSLRLLAALVTVAVLVGVFLHLRDPLQTALPFGSTDLSTLEAQLARLEPADRERVEAYVKRSNGDVLPEKFADPDEPFTARTFAEAIALERAWEVKRAAMESAAASRQAQRDAAMTPLRDALDAEVASARIVSPRELSSPPPTGDAAKQALPSEDATVFAVTISLHNLGSRTIVAVQGSLEANDGQPLPMDLCWIDAHERIEPASRVEVRCANINRIAGRRQRDFVDDTTERFSVTWNPKRIVFEDGTTLESGL